MSHKDTRSIKQEYHGIDHQQHDFWWCLEVGYVYIYIYPKKLRFFIGNMTMIMELLGVLCSDKAILHAEQLIWSTSQWEFQDPKMEVLYHIRPYFVGIFPEI